MSYVLMQEAKASAAMEQTKLQTKISQNILMYAWEGQTYPAIDYRSVTHQHIQTT